MFYGRTRLPFGVATAGHDAVALAGEDYAKFVPEIVLEVDDPGVRIDVPGACGVWPLDNAGRDNRLLRDLARGESRFDVIIFGLPHRIEANNML